MRDADEELMINAGLIRDDRLWMVCKFVP